MVNLFYSFVKRFTYTFYINYNVIEAGYNALFKILIFTLMLNIINILIVNDMLNYIKRKT